MHNITLRQIGQYLLFAVTAYFGISMAVFPLVGGRAVDRWHLPYVETFDYIQTLDYPQLGGNWEVRNGALLQTVETDTDLMAVIPVDLQPDQPYRFQTHLDFRGGQHSGGLMFNLQQPNSRQQSQLVRFGSGQGLNYLIYGYFDEQGSFVTQGTTTPFELIQPVSGVDLGVKVGTDTYDVYLNNNLVASGVPLIYSGGQLALTTWFSQVAFDNISIDLLEVEAPPQFVATDVPQSGVIIAAFTDTFEDPSTESEWLSLGGNWTFESGTLIQSSPEGEDYSISHAAAYEQFILRVQFSHREGAGAGVLFNMPQTDSLHNAQIVRYQDENNLVWGYFDDEGIFQQQGSTPVMNPETSSRILEVATNGSSYGIMLDGRPITVGVPLHSTNGYIGLTTSNAIAAFEQVEIFTDTAGI